MNKPDFFYIIGKNTEDKPTKWSIDMNIESIKIQSQTLSFISVWDYRFCVKSIVTPIKEQIRFKDLAHLAFTHFCEKIRLTHPLPSIQQNVPRSAWPLTPEGSCEMVGTPMIDDINSHHSILEEDIGSNPDLMMSGHLNRSSESML